MLLTAELDIHLGVLSGKVKMRAEAFWPPLCAVQQTVDKALLSLLMLFMYLFPFKTMPVTALDAPLAAFYYVEMNGSLTVIRHLQLLRLIFS